MIETELKFFLGDEAAARAVVTAAGLEWHGGELEVNRIYDTPEGTLRQAQSIVRLRTRGETAWLTFKQKTDPGDSIAKVRIEHETEVSNSGAVAEILAALGLAETLRYEKYRASYDLAGARLDIDRLPGGWFCEIEGSTDTISVAQKACGLADISPIPYTYPGLCHKLHTSKRLEKTRWIFPATDEASISLPPKGDPWWGEPRK